MIIEEEIERLKNFLSPKTRKRTLNFELNYFKLQIARGYRGVVRNDYTTIIYSKSYARFLFSNKKLILGIKFLPKYRLVGFDADNWIGVAQSAVFVANMVEYEKMDAYEKAKHENSLCVQPFKEGEKLVSDAMFISPYRYETFIVGVLKTLSYPEKLFEAVQRFGLLTQNVPPWDTFYFFVYCAKLANIETKYMIQELSKFNDYFGFENLNYAAIEQFYDKVDID